MSNDFNENESVLILSDEIINEFFNYILKELYKEKITLSNSIRNILNTSKDISKTIKDLSSKILNLLKNPFENFDSLISSKIINDNNNISLSNNINFSTNDLSEKKIKNKIIQGENLLKEETDGKLCTFSDLDLNQREKMIFNKILEKLNLSKHFKEIMKLRERNLLKSKFKFVKTNAGEALIIPQNGFNYKFNYYATNKKLVRFRCSSIKCSARGYIDKGNLNFVLEKGHDLPPNMHIVPHLLGKRIKIGEDEQNI